MIMSRVRGLVHFIGSGMCRWNDYPTTSRSCSSMRWISWWLTTIAVREENMEESELYKYPFAMKYDLQRPIISLS
jgi:hypothetical protein